MNLARVGWFRVGLLSFVAGCQHLNFSRGEQPPEKPPSCLGTPEELAKKKFGVDGALEDRLKAVWGGVLHLESTSKKLEEKLASSCDNLARALPLPAEPKPAKPADGASGEKPASEKAESAKSESTTESKAEPAESGASDASKDEAAATESGETSAATALGVAEVACQKALDQLKAYKEKTGASVSIDAKPFNCGVRTDDFATCARRCDTNLPPGNLEVGCEEGKQRGRCGGKCTGQCAEINTTECAAKCEGECKGACNKGFYGKCGGKCIGTCDMANVNGKCEGMCDGKCLSEAAGTCEEKCTGKCVGACLADVKSKACDGNCRGQCDAPMSAAVCGQVYPPAEMGPECVAECSAELTSKFQCSVDHVGITLVRSEKESDGLKLKNALTSHLKDILEVGDGMKVPFDDAAARVNESLEALTTELEANSEAQKAVGKCMTEATERKGAALSTVSKFGDLSAAILQAARN